MTSDQKRAAIAAEVARGEDALAEAAILFAAAKLAGAISRAYYAAFHYARALLLSIDTEPRSHGGVNRLLQANFVRGGRMTPEVAAMFSRLLSARQDADYTAESVFTAPMAEAELDKARTFVSAAHAILAQDGWVAAAT